MEKQPGLQILGDFHQIPDHCRELKDAGILEQKCLQAVSDSKLTALHSHFHCFENEGGVTGIIVLAESHLAVHTWPEKGYVTVDVFVCNYNQNNREKAKNLYYAVEKIFNPRYTHVREIDRD